jgi:hypothetical protein
MMCKTCPSATLSATYLTWSGSGSQTSDRDDRPATSHLSHGTAYSVLWLIVMFVLSARTLQRIRSASQSRDNITNVCCLHVKCPLFLSDLNQNLSASRNFSKNLLI